MGVAPRVLTRLESAAKNGMDSHRLKIIRRYDAPSRDLGPLADAESGPHNLRHNKCVTQPAPPLQIDEIRPGNTCMSGFSARRSGKSEQLLLVSHRGVRTE